MQRYEKSRTIKKNEEGFYATPPPVLTQINSIFHFLRAKWHENCVIGVHSWQFVLGKTKTPRHRAVAVSRRIFSECVWGGGGLTYDALGNALGIDGGMARGHEEQAYDVACLMGAADEIDLALRREDGLEDEAPAVTQTGFTLLLAVAGCLQNGLGRVPVAEPVLCLLVGVHIDGILQPFVAQYLRRNRSLARPVGAGNDDKYRAAFCVAHVSMLRLLA